MHHSLKIPLPARLASLFLLLLLSLGLLSFWITDLVNDRARTSQLTRAREHYLVVLADLDRRWGREAFNLKTRIEAQDFLESDSQRNEKLLTFLTAQGSSIEFPSLRIENTKGEIIAAYDYASHINPKVKFSPGQVSTWTMDASDEHLYLAIRQFIWLGKENGYLVLFKPMDHALLHQITYPGTRLSLWWKGLATASSDGEDGLKRTAATFEKPESNDSSIALTWSGPETDMSPRLLVETLGMNLVSFREIAAPALLIFLVMLLGTTFSFAGYAIKSSRQLDALLQADKRFSSLATLDDAVMDDLRIAQSGPIEGVGTLAASLEERMRNPAKLDT